MLRPDYGSLYKFIASAGLALVAFGIALPAVIRPVSDGLLLTKDDVSALAPAARTLWLAKTRIALLSLSIWPWLSAASLVAGPFITARGLAKWKRQQDLADEREENELKLLKGQVAMTTAEIEANAASEARAERRVGELPERDAAVAPEAGGGSQALTKEKVLSVEREVLSLLQASLKWTHRGQPHVKIKSGSRVAVVDAVFEARDPAYLDVVVEVQYMRGPHRVAEAMLQIATIARLYEEATGRDVDPLVIVVIAAPARPDHYPRRKREVLARANRAVELLTRPAKLAVVAEHDLAGLEPAEFYAKLPEGIGQRKASDSGAR